MSRQNTPATEYFYLKADYLPTRCVNQATTNPHNVMIRLFTFILLVLLSAPCFAQFRVDALSGNCYVRTGEGSVRLVDKTKLLHLPVYKNDGSLNRRELKKRKIRQGFSRPAVYGQDPNNPKLLVETRPAQETEILELYIIIDTGKTDAYEWEYIQESWTEYEGYVYNDAWQRCNCAVDNASLQVVADVLIQEGDLPEGFRVDEANEENRTQFIVALNDYARGYELKPVLDKAAEKIYVPFPVLETMYLSYNPKAKLIQSLARR